MSGLAEQQAALVRALVAGGGTPSGFEPGRLEATVRALLRKRLQDVRRTWPALLATPAARDRFLHWADGRPKTTSLSDGLSFALDEQRRGTLSADAATELRRHRHRHRGRRSLR